MILAILVLISKPLLEIVSFIYKISKAGIKRYNYLMKNEGIPFNRCPPFLLIAVIPGVSMIILALLLPFGMLNLAQLEEISAILIYSSVFLGFAFILIPLLTDPDE